MQMNRRFYLISRDNKLKKILMNFHPLFHFWYTDNRDLRIVFFRSNRISNRIGRPIRFRIELAVTTQAVTQPNGLQAYRTACYRPNWVLVYFNSVIKRDKQCCCTLILLPKSTLNANLTTTNEWRLTARTIRKLRIEPSIRIESRIGRTIRNRIESRNFAGP